MHDGLHIHLSALFCHNLLLGYSLLTQTSVLSVGVRVPVCSGELRHWEHGHYTMIHDHDPERQEFALDLLWFCGCEGQ